MVGIRRLSFRDSLVFNLLSQPEGAFVVRHSESKTKCLALSMRVPYTHNPGGISHYLIIRNENGFRLKVSRNDEKKFFINFFLLFGTEIEVKKIKRKSFQFFASFFFSKIEDFLTKNSKN